MKAVKKVAVVTGTRADYWLLRPLMKRIEAEGLELQVFATSMHLSQSLGYTLGQVKRDFDVTAVVDMGVKEKNTMKDMANSLSMGISGFTDELGRHRPDIVVVLGDRIEMLAAALAATFLGIPIAHLHGGDKTGNIDDRIRNLITKLAHVHLPATKKSAKRIEAMGEEKRRILVTGSLYIDANMQVRIMPGAELRAKYGLGDKPIISVLYHPESKGWENAGKTMEGILRAVCESAREKGCEVFAIYPNSDAGGYLIIDRIREYQAKGMVKSAQTLLHPEYCSLLRESAVLVGNTTSGIIEAPFFKLPVVNIGTRQQDRERGGNVIDCDASPEAVKKAIRTALSPGFRRKILKKPSPYGSGGSSERIVKVLKQIDLSGLQKG